MKEHIDELYEYLNVYIEKGQKRSGLQWFLGRQSESGSFAIFVEDKTVEIKSDVDYRFVLSLEEYSVSVIIEHFVGVSNFLELIYLLS